MVFWALFLGFAFLHDDTNEIMTHDAPWMIIDSPRRQNYDITASFRYVDSCPVCHGEEGDFSRGIQA